MLTKTLSLIGRFSTSVDYLWAAGKMRKIYLSFLGQNCCFTVSEEGLLKLFSKLLCDFKRASENVDLEFFNIKATQIVKTIGAYTESTCLIL
jgi:hypothetical protein